jgi:hypothetical protein
MVIAHSLFTISNRHVNGFLKEIGQGVQHIASRVDNLIDFVQRANDYREMTGEGFTFLRIPRSYYGTLSTNQLVGTECGVSLTCAEAIIEACEAGGLVSLDGAVRLDVGAEDVDALLRTKLKDDMLKIFIEKEEQVIQTILRSRYSNLYSLLRDNLSEESYLGLVRNQILVDVQVGVHFCIVC